MNIEAKIAEEIYCEVNEIMFYDLVKMVFYERQNLIEIFTNITSNSFKNNPNLENSLIKDINNVDFTNTIRNIILNKLRLKDKEN
jgi:hypothetical protein